MEFLFVLLAAGLINVIFPNSMEKLFCAIGGGNKTSPPKWDSYR